MSETGPPSSALARAASRLAVLPADFDRLLADLCEDIGLVGASLVSGAGLDTREVGSWGDARSPSSHHVLPTASRLSLHLYGPSPSAEALAPWLGLLSAAEARAATSRGDDRDRLNTAGGLLRMIGHDLRNLVSAFDQNLEFAMQSLEELSEPPPDTLVEDLEQVSGASSRVLSYVHRIHQLAHILQGPWEVASPDSTLARAMVGLAEGGAANGALQVRVTEGMPGLALDLGHASLMLNELVENARLAGARKIRLSLVPPSEVNADLSQWVSELPDGGWVTLQCEDDGIGMDAFLLTRCVEPLVFHPDSQDRAGLGLSMVRAILRAVGGRLGIVSRGGKGTTVVLAIPAATHPGPGPGGAARVVVPESARVRVALRVDDTGFVAWVREVLREIQVTVVDEPREAEVLIADRKGALLHPGSPCGMFFIGSGWPPGVPRPDAVMMPSPDREGFIRRLSMAVTRSRSA